MMNTPKMKKNVNLSDMLIDAIAWAFWYFLNPAIVMWGWEALAPHLNMPLFSYWQSFCICYGAQWLLSFVFRSRK